MQRKLTSFGGRGGTVFNPNVDHQIGLHANTFPGSKNIGGGGGGLRPLSFVGSAIYIPAMLDIETTDLPTVFYILFIHENITNTSNTRTSKHKKIYWRPLDKPVFKSGKNLQSLEDLISDLDSIVLVSDTKLIENKLCKNYNAFNNYTP